jgi:hypothetical protein
MVEGIMKCRFKQALRLFLCILAILSISCSSEANNATPTHTEQQLPPIDITADIECQADAKGATYLSLQDWVKKGDGIVVGTIKSVEPAIGLGYTAVPEGQSMQQRIKGPSECKSIRNAFKVTLENVGGYLHDETISDEIDIYFGSTTGSRFDGVTVRNGQINWPNNTPIFERGMVVGGLVYKSNIVDRWSFRPSLEMPIFEIPKNQGLQFQEMVGEADTECLKWPPLNKLTELSKGELLTRINDLASQNRLWTKRENRDWARDSGISDWVGGCEYKQ